MEKGDLYWLDRGVRIVYLLWSDLSLLVPDQCPKIECSVYAFEVPCNVITCSGTPRPSHFKRTILALLVRSVRVGRK